MTNFESYDGNPLSPTQRDILNALPNFHYMKYTFSISILHLTEAVERRTEPKEIFKGRVFSHFSLRLVQ